MLLRIKVTMKLLSTLILQAFHSPPILELTGPYLLKCTILKLQFSISLSHTHSRSVNCTLSSILHKITYSPQTTLRLYDGLIFNKHKLNIFTTKLAIF